jgi:hypothetical protein
VNSVQVQSDVILLTDQPAGVDLIEPDRQLDQLMHPTQIVDLTRFATFQPHWCLFVLHMLPPLCEALTVNSTQTLLFSSYVL